MGRIFLIFFEPANGRCLHKKIPNQTIRDFVRVIKPRD